MSCVASFKQADPFSFSHDRSEQRRLARAVHEKYPDTLYPPVTLSHQGMHELARSSEELHSMISQVPEVVFHGDVEAWLFAQGIPESDWSFFKGQLRRTSRTKALAVARADALLTEDGFKFVELNISPALGGLGVCDGYAERLKTTRLWKHLCDRFSIELPSVDSAWLKAIRSLVRKDSASASPPFFFEAIADPYERHTDSFDRPEWLAFVRASGIEVETGHVSSLRVDDSGVYLGDRHVDIVYFCFTYQEMLQHGVDPGLIADLTDADAAHAVNLFTSFASVPFDSKANLAFLCAEDTISRWSSERQALIRQFIPRTEILTDNSASQVIARRENTVLKGSLDFGGSAVHIGSETRPDDWRRLVKQAVKNKTPTVAQELVGETAVSDWGDSGSAASTLCAGPMLFGGTYSGTLLRSSPYHGRPEVTNVARGASFGTALERKSNATDRVHD